MLTATEDLMHIEDIEADLLEGDIRGLEGAFRALVGWPGEETIEGLTSTHDLMVLLEDVAGALAADTSVMPGGIFDLINSETDGDLAGPTYKDGATALLADPRHWAECLKHPQ